MKNKLLGSFIFTIIVLFYIMVFSVIFLTPYGSIITDVFSIFGFITVTLIMMILSVFATSMIRSGKQ